MADASYGLLYAFMSDDPQYALGFESGMIAARMASKEWNLSATIHSVSKPQILAMAAHYGYACEFSFLNDDWLDLFANPTTSPDEVPGARPTTGEQP